MTPPPTTRCALIGAGLGVVSFPDPTTHARKGNETSLGVIVMASKDVDQVERGDEDAELVLAMVTSPSLSSSDAGAILLGLCCECCNFLEHP